MSEDSKETKLDANAVINTAAGANDNIGENNNVNAYDNTNAVKQTKTSTQENFPVGSFLIPAKLRPHVFAYYNFARRADDIADSAVLSSDEKIAKLDRLENVLLGKETEDESTSVAVCLAKSLEMTRINHELATDLLIAFRQDARGYQYDTFFELMNYCKYSACPVGRYMLELVGEAKETYHSSDILCSALQIINHIQDAKKDWLELGRAYLPMNFMKEQNLTYDCLAKDVESPEFTAVKMKMTELTRGLLKDSAALPLLMFNYGLRSEVCVIHNLAVRLLEKLEKNDILACHLKLSKADWILGTLCGIGNGICRKKINY